MKDGLGKNKLTLLAVFAALVFGYWLGQRPPQSIYRAPGIVPQLEVVPAAPFDAPKQTALPEERNREPDSSERLVVKSGALSLLVKDVRESVGAAQKLATDLGGFVVDSQTDVVDEKRGAVRATVTIRVPAEKFDEALLNLKNGAVKVTSENTSGQDVTEEYTDLQSRLKNLEATEAQLLKIMERAGEIKDVLAVQQELMRVREPVEVTKGRIKFLEESAAMSKITAHFATEEEELPIVEERWRPLAAVKEGLRALVSFGQTVADKLIFWAVFLSPVIAVVLIIWFLRKLSTNYHDRGN